MKNSTHLTTDSFSVMARFYDLEHAEYQEDIPFYLNLAQRTGGPILDAGTGTGRVALALARAGHEVVGLDSSPEMLALAKNKARGNVAKRLTLQQGDLRGFRLPQRFPLILVALNGFSHLVEQAEQEGALACFCEHLTQDGLLVIALQNPYHWALDEQPNQVLFAWERPGPAKNQRTTKTFSGWADLSRQVRHLQLWYDVTDSRSALQRFSVSFSLRWFYRYELALLLDRCHLRVEEWYGSYELEPYSDESPQLLLVAKRA